MAEEFMCSAHGFSRESTCSWCGEPICKECIESSGYKKYCPTCYIKISKNSVADAFRQMPKREPQERVSNTDSSLSEEDIKEFRAQLEQKEKVKKAWDGIKNKRD